MILRSAAVANAAMRPARTTNTTAERMTVFAQASDFRLDTHTPATANHIPADTSMNHSATKLGSEPVVMSSAAATASAPTSNEAARPIAATLFLTRGPGLFRRITNQVESRTSRPVRLSP